MSLVVKDLSIRVGSQHLVKGVSLSIARGDVVALVGPSGSGKSLTAASLSGSLPGSAMVRGHLEADGQETPLGDRTRAGIAAIRQDSLTSLHPLVRIDRQLVPVLLRSGEASTRAGALARAELMLEKVGFTAPKQVLCSFPMELSGGQRQRVCIVQALACRASYLIADEPTTALDGVSQQLVLSAFRTAAEAGAGILLITHDVVAASSLCSRAVIIDAGSVVDQGSFSHLASKAAHPVARSLSRAAHQTTTQDKPTAA